MKQNRSSTKTVRMVQLAVLSAVIIVLQLLSYSILKIGEISISLVLVPVVAGAFALGPASGAFLGFVFGAVTLVGCISGVDIGGNILLVANPVLTSFLCIAKGTLCGWLPGLLYRALRKRSHAYWTDLVCAALCPVVNTGVFLTITLLFYRDILTAWAGGTALLTYVIVGLVGINFLVELCLNVFIAPPVSRAMNKLIASGRVR